MMKNICSSYGDENMEKLTKDQEERRKFNETHWMEDPLVLKIFNRFIEEEKIKETDKNGKNTKKI